jgi:uncharacterized protein
VAVSRLDDLVWLNPPPVAEPVAEGLRVVTGKGTDFWRGTFYGFWRDSGHFLSRPVSGDFSAEVTITGRFETLYDQAGLMVRLSETHWIKAGIEFADGAMQFSVVVTNDHSDWSQMPVRADGGRLRLRLTRHGEAIRIQYLDEGDGGWRAARLAYLPKSESIEVGVMCCSPERAGFEVVFSDFSIGPPISRNLHED